MRAILAPGHLIRNVVPYVDTVRIRLPRYLRAAELRNLFSVSPKSIYKRDRIKWFPQWKSTVLLQYPTSELLKEASWISEGARVTRIDFSLDLVTDSYSDAWTLQEFLDTHQVKSWRGNQRVGSYGGTSYSSNTPKVGTLLVRYSDRPSKVIDSPCCHLEWRIFSTQVLLRMGIKSPQNIQLINHRAFWERRLRLLQVDFDALENGFVSSSGNLSARRRAILVWRSTGTVQELLDNFRPLVKDVLKPIGTGWIVSQIPAIKCG